MAIVDGFLTNISTFLRSKDSTKLRDWLRVEPPVPDEYWNLSRELKRSWKDNSALERHIEKLIPERKNPKPDEGEPWPGFLALIQEYLVFWREFSTEDLLSAHRDLSTLVNSCFSALTNPTYGVVVLPTAVQLSVALVKLTMTLEKRPDLTRKLRKVDGAGQGGENRKSLVERTAELIQKAFTTCLTDRSANMNGIGPDGRPAGKKIGIYQFANLVLKLYFQSRKTRLANQLFTNITQHSPPLMLYPASQRVTYLYYLGRFYFSNNHFYRAQQCLEEAYSQCHALAIRQRRQILIYLLTTNIILGRFFGPSFLARQEAQDLLQKFAPIQNAIKTGNIVAFKRALGKQGGNEEWFFNRGILLPLLYRAEPLVWRSLARRTFILTYVVPMDPNSRKAATLSLEHLVAAAQYCQKILQGWALPSQDANSLFVPTSDLLPPSSSEQRKLGPSEGTIYGDTMPDLLEIEAIISSLVQQGIMHGFVAHQQRMFAVVGAKSKGGPLAAGWPSPWTVMSNRALQRYRGEVAGWVKEGRRAGVGGVVNLTGIARAVGTGG